MIATPVATSAGVVSAANKRPAVTKAVLNGLLLGGRMSTIVLLSRSKTIKSTLGCDAGKLRSITGACVLGTIVNSLRTSNASESQPPLAPSRPLTLYFRGTLLHASKSQLRTLLHASASQLSSTSQLSSQDSNTAPVSASSSHSHSSSQYIMTQAATTTTSNSQTQHTHCRHHR